MALESVKSVSVEPPDLFEVQNPNRFTPNLVTWATAETSVEPLKATDTSAEAVFDYLMERAARPE